MRTTLNLNDLLVKKAMEMTKIKEKTSLIHKALELIINQCARERLIALGGSNKKIKAPPRRKVK